MKNKLKTTSFWLGLSGVVVIILESISTIIGIDLYPKVVEGIVLSICSILVTIGIVTKKNEGDKENTTKEELLKEIDKVSDEIEEIKSEK